MKKNAAENILNFLRTTHDRAVDYSHHFAFDRNHPLYRTAVSYYGTILELTSSCVILINKSLGTAIPILLRAILEAYVDFHNLCSDSKYGYYLEASYIHEWLKILKEAKKGKNEYLSQISKAPSLDGMIKSWNEAQNKLDKKDGYKQLSVFERFQKAGMENEYCSIYNSLCCDSHNNIRALVSRHIEFKDKDLSVVFYKDLNLSDIEQYIGMASELLVRATIEIHTLLDSPVLEEVSKLREEIENLKADIYQA